MCDNVKYYLACMYVFAYSGQIGECQPVYKLTLATLLNVVYYKLTYICGGLEVGVDLPFIFDKVMIGRFSYIGNILRCCCFVN